MGDYWIWFVGGLLSCYAASRSGKCNQVDTTFALRVAELCSFVYDFIHSRVIPVRIMMFSCMMWQIFIYISIIYGMMLPKNAITS